MESEISSSEVLFVRLLETLTMMTPISTESSASGWQRLAVVDLGTEEVVACGFRFDLRYFSTLL